MSIRTGANSLKSQQFRRLFALLAGVSTLAVAGSLLLDRAAPHRSADRPAPAAETVVASRLIIRFAAEAESGRLASRAEAESALRAIGRSLGAAFAYSHPTAGLSHVVRWRAPSEGGDLEGLLRDLRADPRVSQVEVDGVVRRALTPNDELYADAREILWNLKAPSGARAGGMNLPIAWDRTRGAGVTVAVLDTGIERHADLDVNVLPNGYDFIRADVDGAFRVANDGDGLDPDPTDEGDWIAAADLAFPVFTGCAVANSSWHGMSMAGVIAAIGNNNVGQPGVAFEAKILPVRVLGKCKGYQTDIADAIRWASGAQPESGTWAALGVPTNITPARVINLSLSGSGTCPSFMQSAINAARAAGAVVVVATGNDGAAPAIGASTIGSPANCDGVIAVTSHTIEGDRMTIANWGPGTDLSAPGGGACSQLGGCLPHGTLGANGTVWRELWSTRNDGTTIYQDPPPDRLPLWFGPAGTSVSAAHTSGAAALLLSAMPSLNPEGVESILKTSTRAFPAGTYCWVFEIGTLNCGYGMLDATSAMTRLTALTPTVTASTSAAIAAAGSTVTLTGSATPGSAGSANNLSYSWQQLSGPVVTLSGAATAVATFPAPSPGGALSFRFTATDVTGASASTTVNMRANTAPTVDAIAGQTVRAGQTVAFTATGADVEGDSLTFAATGLPAGATFSTAGVFNWPASVAGTYTVSVTASDGNLTSAARAVTITVTPNTPPTVNAITNPSVRAGEAVNFSATGTDAESDALTFSATGVPTGATFSPAGVFIWPVATPAGTYTVSITASDGVFTSAARTVTITVRANTAPTVDTIADRTARAAQALNFSIPATDAENDALTFAATGLPTGATLSAAGAFSWPEATPAGTYTVSVTASDGLLTSAARSFTITVTPNTAPTVNPIADRTARAGQALGFSVTGTDAENDALTFTATGLPTGATLSTAGVFSWSNASPAGTYTVSVTASDGLLSSAARSFTITVTPNTAPTVDPVTGPSVRAGETASFTVTGTDAESDALTFAATGLPTGATLSAAGVFTWPNASPAGTYTVSVTASDGVFTSAPRPVTITVRANTAPTVNTIADRTARAGQTVSFTVTGTDPEGDALTFAATGLPTGATISAAGAFSWPNASPAGTYTVSVTASDGLLTSVVRTVTITITANTAPTVNVITDRTVRAGQSVSLSVTGTDPENDALTFAATGLPTGATLSAAGAFSWPDATPAGTYTVSVTASDGLLTSAARSFTITVTTNTAPTVNAIADRTARAGQAVTFTATGTDAENDALTFAATGLPTGATFSAAGVFNWPVAVTGTYTVSVTASDGVYTSVARPVSITVRANTAPTVDAIVNPSVRAGQAVVFTATGSDPEGDALTFAATGVPTGATFSAAGVFNWSNATPAGTYPVVVTASDGLLTSAARTVTITVRANTAPTIAAVPNQTVRAGQALTFNVSATDAESDAVTLSVSGLPTNATFSTASNEGSGTFTWPAPVAGTYTVTFSASDGLLTSAARSVTITVTPNTAPSVNAVPAQTVRAGASLTFTATGTDAENDALTYSATGLPTGATFSTAGVFSWSNATPVGSYNVSITASDGLLTSAVRTVAITVRANTAPTVTPVRNFTVRLTEAVNLTIAGTDPENDAITFSATGLPSGATLSAAGALTWASASPGGDYPITVTASDGLLTSAPMTFTITVTNRASDPGGGGGSMDLLGLGLLGLWGLARLRRRRSDDPEDRNG
jgi:hypothetical protein